MKAIQAIVLQKSDRDPVPLPSPMVPPLESMAAVSLQGAWSSRAVSSSTLLPQHGVRFTSILGKWVRDCGASVLKPAHLIDDGRPKWANPATPPRAVPNSCGHKGSRRIYSRKMLLWNWIRVAQDFGVKQHAKENRPMSPRRLWTQFDGIAFCMTRFGRAREV